MASVSAYVEKSARSTGDFGPTASDQKLHLVVYGKMSQRHVCMSTFVLENELFTVKKKKLRIETGEQAYRIAVVSTSGSKVWSKCVHVYRIAFVSSSPTVLSSSTLDCLNSSSQKQPSECFNHRFRATKFLFLLRQQKQSQSDYIWRRNE